MQNQKKCCESSRFEVKDEDLSEMEESRKAKTSWRAHLFEQGLAWKNKSQQKIEDGLVVLNVSKKLQKVYFS